MACDDADATCIVEPPKCLTCGRVLTSHYRNPPPVDRNGELQYSSCIFTFCDCNSPAEPVTGEISDGL